MSCKTKTVRDRNEISTLLPTNRAAEGVVASWGEGGGAVEEAEEGLPALGPPQGPQGAGGGRHQGAEGADQVLRHLWPRSTSRGARLFNW